MGEFRYIYSSIHTIRSNYIILLYCFCSTAPAPVLIAVSFSFDKLWGSGSWRSAHGDLYEGRFVEDSIHGIGTYQSAHGEVKSLDELPYTSDLL